MPKRVRPVRLLFPAGGLNRRFAHRQQPPYTTPLACNVRPFGPIDRRNRAGSRPGIGKAFPDELGSGKPVLMLAEVTSLASTGYKAWQDNFDGVTLASLWSTASWLTYAPSIMDPGGVAGTYDVEVGAVRTTLGIDTSQAYQVSLFVTPHSGEFHGKYRLYLRMDNSSPDVTDEGLEVELEMTGIDGTYDGKATEYHSGSPTVHDFTPGDHTYPEAGWFRVLVTANNIKVFWHSTMVLDQAISSHSGKRLGFGFECTVAGGACTADFICVQYRDGTSNEVERRILVASSDGSIYREDELGNLDVLSVDLTLSNAHTIMAQERGGLLFMADYATVRILTGTDGVIAGNGVDLDAASVPDWTAKSIRVHDDVVVISEATGAVKDGTYKISAIVEDKLTLAASAGGAGNCAFRVVRGPKIFNPGDDSVSIWVATADKGQVPSDCPFIWLYRDRMGVAGYPMHQWYMSRQGDPHDWDYSISDLDDTGRAVAGNNAEAGLLGDPLRAVVPFADDYLIFGCDASIWVLSGDPTIGGELDNLSRNIGIVDKFAWCWGPKGELIFLSRDGLYVLPPGASAVPQPLSRPRVPDELLSVNTDLFEVSMAFDPREHGIHLFVTSRG